MKKLLLAILAGVLLGLIGAKYIFVNSGLSLIPWTLVGLGLGFICSRRRQAVAVGALYGFVLSFSFMLFSYNGTTSLVSRVPFFLILGLFGAVCGLVLGLISWFVKQMVAKPR